MRPKSKLKKLFALNLELYGITVRSGKQKICGFEKLCDGPQNVAVLMLIGWRSQRLNPDP